MQGSESPSYLLHVNGAHTNRRDQIVYDPWYGSIQWTLELCHQRPGTAFVKGLLLGSEFVPRAPAESEFLLSVKGWSL
ncbi:hypothetical protein TNCT_642571 [Trichonephila clavata]|uniref:Uncharacterized protein n=1 Tax=Trichonephila clavata TaxID=2740835 RepID=A0A8X6HLN2_TRICU|nr:hypothetical protein TNCT_642571 [Trichonephila clavata]